MWLPKFLRTKEAPAEPGDKVSYTIEIWKDRDLPSAKKIGSATLKDTGLDISLTKDITEFFDDLGISTE